MMHGTPGLWSERVQKWSQLFLEVAHKAHEIPGGTKPNSLKPLVPVSAWYGDVMLAFSVVLLIRGEGNFSANNAIGGDMTDS